MVLWAALFGVLSTVVWRATWPASGARTLDALMSSYIRGARGGDVKGLNRLTAPDQDAAVTINQKIRLHGQDSHASPRIEYLSKPAPGFVYVSIQSPIRGGGSAQDTVWAVELGGRWYVELGPSRHPVTRGIRPVQIPEITGIENNQVHH